MTALKSSLTALKTEYVDLYLVHWPHNAVDETGKALKKVPMHKIWAGMEDCVRQGLAKQIGICSFNVQLLCDLLAYAEIPPAVH